MSEEFSEHDLERCKCGHTRMGHIQGFGACLHFLSAKYGSECDCKKFEPSENEHGD